MQAALEFNPERLARKRDEANLETRLAELTRIMCCTTMSQREYGKLWREYVGLLERKT